MLLAHKLIHQFVVDDLRVDYDPLCGIGPDPRTRITELVWQIPLAQKFAIDGALIDDEQLKTTAVEFWRAGVLRPPFDLTWWEFTWPDGAVGILVSYDPVRRRTIFDGFRYEAGKWIDGGFQSYTDYAATPPEGANFFYKDHYGDFERARECAIGAIQNVVIACCIMVSKGSVTEIVLAPEKLNKARESKGKPPLFEHRVITVPSFSGRALVLGGTHASPRLHWRRGHLRRLPRGDLTAVRPTLVGLAENGVITKDYLVAAVQSGAMQ